jgi:glucan phosphoethanolaminetransferase (alkaline phosphatase superfamily)
MNEFMTTTIMITIFVTIGILLPVFLMIRDKTQQSSLPNKLILWITMIFCMVMVFGIVVNFQQLSDSIRADLVQYGFVALMLFGGIFGIDQLLKSHYIKSIQWKDLRVTSQESASHESASQESAIKEETSNEQIADKNSETEAGQSERSEMEEQKNEVSGEQKP